MKYKLINRATNEAHMCDKVTIDGFDYYFIDGHIDSHFKIRKSDNYLSSPNSLRVGKHKDYWTVIATNNPSIDIPKVVDEVDKLANLYANSAKVPTCEYDCSTIEDAVKYGYNKSQETHPNSDEDMIEFANWLLYNPEACFNKPKKELLELWKLQQTKVLYYE